MEEDFYATIKINTGEEIFSKVSVCEEHADTFLLLSNPITVQEIKIKGNSIGYKVEPWLKTSSDDMFLLPMSRVVTISENDNIEIISVYNQFLRNEDIESNPYSVRSSLNKEMGYISSVLEAKEILEKLYKL
jgi:hypothetical protein